MRVNLLAALLLAAAALAQAQTAAEKPSVDTRRVGMHLRCQCGCPDSVATCAMLECSFSKPAKERIARMQALGMTDGQIIDSFVRDYGAGVYLSKPSAFGWIIPYTTVGLGLLGLWWFLARFPKQPPLAELGPMQLDDPALEKYKDQIEKDLANFE
jgi:cytochrome c-type biogenesis protein CcmH/NrfF